MKLVTIGNNDRVLFYLTHVSLNVSNRCVSVEQNFVEVLAAVILTVNVYLSGRINAFFSLLITVTQSIFIIRVFT